MIKLFFATLSFISRIPVPGRWVQGLDGADYVRGITTFPLVGLLLGGLSGLLFMVLHTWCGAPLAALLSVLALALLTGGFHLDGLADTCDGVFSARRRERMLEIMRDSRLGTHGGVGPGGVAGGKNHGAAGGAAGGTNGGERGGGGEPRPCHPRAAGF